MSAQRRKTPALVVSGFLGSGKTTLVRHLLAEARKEGLRVAVVSNELGELGIDQALLGEGSQAYVELEGGCVCCKLSDDLLETLETLHKEVDPDRVIVETSGVALPYDTLINFWREPVRQWSADEVAVVVVNAEQVAEGRDLDGTFEDQICSADMIVVNKTDLVDAAALAQVEAVIRELEPDAPIVYSSRGRLDPDLLFPPDPDGARLARRTDGEPTHDHDHENFKVEVVTVERGIEATELARRIEAMGALRAKGFVETADGLRVVQGVGRRVEIEAAEAPEAEIDSAMIGRVVVIRRAN